MKENEGKKMKLSTLEKMHEVGISRAELYKVMRDNRKFHREYTVEHAQQALDHLMFSMEYMDSLDKSTLILDEKHQELIQKHFRRSVCDVDIEQCWLDICELVRPSEESDETDRIWFREAHEIARFIVLYIRQTSYCVNGMIENEILAGATKIYELRSETITKDLVIAQCRWIRVYYDMDDNLEKVLLELFRLEQFLKKYNDCYIDIVEGYRVFCNGKFGSHGE